MNTTDDRVLYRPREVANLLACSRGLVYKLLERGDLRATYVTPRCVRVAREDLEEFLEARRQAAQRKDLEGSSANRQGAG